jgi:hypothetical protein
MKLFSVNQGLCGQNLDLYATHAQRSEPTHLSQTIEDGQVRTKLGECHSDI